MIKWVFSLVLVVTALPALATTREAEFKNGILQAPLHGAVKTFPFKGRKPVTGYPQGLNERADGRPNVPKAGIEGVGDGYKLNPSGPMKTASTVKPKQEQLRRYLATHFSNLNLSASELEQLEVLVQDALVLTPAPASMDADPEFWITLIDQALVKLSGI